MTNIFKHWLAKWLFEHAGTEYLHEQTGHRAIVCDAGEEFAKRNKSWSEVGPVYRAAPLTPKEAP